MTNGVIFYNNFTSPIPLLAVALSTLVKHYDGNIHVTLGDSTPEWFVDVIKNFDRVSYSSHTKRSSIGGRRKNRISWYEKPFVIEECPFDRVFYYDCDHIFVDTFDTSIFDDIERHQLVDPIVDPENPLCGQDKILPAAHQLYGRDPSKPLGKSMGGAYGILKNSPAHKDLMRIQEELLTIPGRNNFYDEHAIALVMEKYGKVIPSGWSWTCPKRSSELPPDNLIAIHFAHRRFGKSVRWYDSMLKCKEANFMGFDEHFDKYVDCSEHLKVSLPYLEAERRACKESGYVFYWEKENE